MEGREACARLKLAVHVIDSAEHILFVLSGIGSMRHMERTAKSFKYGAIDHHCVPLRRNCAEQPRGCVTRARAPKAKRCTP
jgi:hypothetical protein